MGVTINKTKGAVKAKAKEQAIPGVYTDAKATVDRMAELTKQINAANAKIAPAIEELAKLEKELKGRVEAELTSDQDARFVGSEFDYTVSDRAMMRSIPDMNDVRKVMGDESFMKCAKVTLGDMDKYLSAKEVANLTVSARTGSRRGKLEPKS